MASDKDRTLTNEDTQELVLPFPSSWEGEPTTLPLQIPTSLLPPSEAPKDKKGMTWPTAFVVVMLFATSLAALAWSLWFFLPEYR